ncbi:MAG: hypothetical protein LH618_15675 [Saprospiraceae bacterium]|nr:hypothetical protein [Saprospiraceae bacterium]
MLLDTLRLELKQLLAAARCEEVFQCLRGDILKSQDCELYDDAVLLENRYREAQRAGNLNVIDFKEKGINFSNVSQALLWLINRISESDLSERRRKQIADHVFLPDFHAFTCDRFEQRDQFELAYWTNTDPRIRCFYLYGDARQEHSGLFASLGYKLGGFLENWENGAYNPGIRIKFARVKPEVRRHPMLYQIDLTKALFARFFPNLSDKTPLQDQDGTRPAGPRLRPPKLW